MQWLCIFGDFQNWGHGCRSLIFFGSSLPKTRRSFHIPKITGALTIITYFLKLANSFILLPRTIIKKTLELIFFSSIFFRPPNKLGNTLFSGATFKNVKSKIYLLILGLQAKFSKALRHKSRQLEMVILWNWVPRATWQVPNFFLKSHSTLMSSHSQLSPSVCFVV